MSTLLDREAVVVEQKRKLFELRNQYGLFSPDGQRIGTVEQVRQGALTLLARVLSDLDVMLPVSLAVTQDGGDGTPVLEIAKPWFRMRTEARGPDGAPLGTIRKRIRLGKARFSIEDPAGLPLGEVRAENWRARDFTVLDANGQEVARVTKKWRGLLTEAFTDADTYVVDLGDTREPMRSLVLASALSVDLVMKQKDR